MRCLLQQARLFILPALIAVAAAAAGCNPEVDNDLEKRRRNASADTTARSARDAGMSAEEIEPEESEPEETDPPDTAPPPVPDAGPPNTCPRARIAVAGVMLNIREAPNTASAVLGSLPNDAVVTVKQKVTGEVVSDNAEWFKIMTSEVAEGFISAAFATCTTDPATQ